MIILNRYALKKEYYILKLVGLVLALNVVLILGWPREHLAQPTNISNVTFNGGHPMEGDIIQDNNNLIFSLDNCDENNFCHYGFNISSLTPKDSNSGELSPSDNEVVVNGSVVCLGEIFIAGGLNYSANSENNIVNLTDSANITGYVYGGYGNGTFNATNNTVVINTTAGVGGSGQVGGGFSSSGIVENNVVNFTYGSVNDLFGGYTGNGTARDNKVIVNGTNANVSNNVYGASAAFFDYFGLSNSGYIIYANGTNLTNNTVEIYDARVTNGIYGGYMPVSSDGNISYNSVLISNSSANSVFGSYQFAGNSFGNNVIIQNSNVSDSVYGSAMGGWKDSYNSSANIVTLQNSIVSNNVSGSYMDCGNSFNNSVIFQNLSVDIVYGSFFMNIGNSTNNSVTSIDSNVTAVYGSFIKGDGNLTDNKVTVKNSNVSDSVYGSFFEGRFDIDGHGYSTNNSVILQNSNVTNSVYGSFVVDGVVIDNIVDISDSKITGDIYGGSVGSDEPDNNSYAPEVRGNEVRLVGTDASNIFGGYARDNSVADVSFNLVNVTEGNGISNIIGGRASKGQALNNTVTIFDTKNIESVIGGYSNISSADSNTVILTNASVTGDVYGGYINHLGDTSGNSVLINNSITTDVYGSFIYISGNSIGNNVTFENSSATDVYGSYMLSGNSYGNNITLQNSNVSNSIYGSLVDSGVANDNIVYVSGGKLAGQIYGGYVGTGFSPYTPEVSGNYVKLDGTDADNNIFGGYARDDSMANVSFNLVNITGGSVTGHIAGGRASIGQAFNNTVFIIDMLDNIESVIGGFSNSSFADNNTVILINVNVTGDVYGGYSNTTSDVSNTSNNTVTLAGVEIGGNLIGGNQNGINNNVIFDSGPRNNLVKGSVNASGELLIVDGSNTINQLTNVGKLNITGGQINTFNSKVNVTGDISIAGGARNVFLADLYSDGDMVVAAGVNTFRDLTTNPASDITLNGPSVNYYRGDIKTQKLSLIGGEHYFVAANQFIDTANDVVASGAYVELGARAALTLTQSLKIAQNSVLKLAGPARLKTTGAIGLGLAGELDLGVHDLDIEGNVTFTSDSILKIDYDGTDQGSLTATDLITLDGEEPIKLDLSYKIDLKSPIIIAKTSEALELTAADFKAPSYIIVNDDVPAEINIYLKTISDTINYLDYINKYKPTDNDKQLIDELSDIDTLNNNDNDNDKDKDKDEESLDAFYSAVKLAEDSGNMGILKRFMKQSSGETMLGVNVAIVDTINQFQGAVHKHLDQIHGDNNAAVPPAAGSANALNRIWVGGHGSWARQKNRVDFFGYDFHSGGFSLGYDYRAEGIAGLRFGLTTSFSIGQMESNNGWTTIDSDTAGLGVYGSYQLNSGLFFDANVAYALSKNSAKNVGINGGWKKGDFDIDTWQIGARVGKIFDLGAIKLIPTVGLSYLNARQDGWAESVHGTPLALVNVFDKKSYHIVELPFLLRLNGSFVAGSAKIIPEIRLGGTLMAKKPDNKLSVGLVNGGPNRWTVTGIKPASGSFQAGAGVKVEINDFWDVFVTYELDAAKGYMSNNVALGVGFNF
ncbi:MAG: autotransporter outer membrane beta-barrel domain-containing protein [Deltaproteobacteria bacterium]|jgi:hypothetical protein|nr:autotransporter outer membrane beta-barrel domain-containing protein [Deltaproteobacteria bacterium]